MQPFARVDVDDIAKAKALLSRLSRGQSGASMRHEVASVRRELLSLLNAGYHTLRVHPRDAYDEPIEDELTEIHDLLRKLDRFL